METTIRLAEGMNWVEVAPLAGGVAKVMAGNVHQAGDLVAAPGGMTWEEASSPAHPNGDTALSPFDLVLRWDAVTESAVAPRAIDAADAADLESVASRPSDPAAKLVEASEREQEMLRVLRASQSSRDDDDFPDAPPAAPRIEPPGERRDAA
jgi:hypothetical protein